MHKLFLIILKNRKNKKKLEIYLKLIKLIFQRRIKIALLKEEIFHQILPDSDVKFYFTCDLDVAAKDVAKNKNGPPNKTWWKNVKIT